MVFCLILIFLLEIVAASVLAENILLISVKTVNGARKNVKKQLKAQLTSSLKF